MPKPPSDRRAAAPDRADGEVYGYVLVLRGLARAAIQLHDKPASLRVLCVLADYMNGDGVCRVSQGTVAARLGISRQAVQKHLVILERTKILFQDGSFQGVPFDDHKPGRTLEYALNTEGLETERAGQDDVDDYRSRRRAERRVGKAKAAHPGADLVEMTERVGYPAFLAIMKPSGFLDRDKRPSAMKAMEAMEAAAGVAYELVAEPPSAPSIWRQVQPQKLHGVQLNGVARGAA